MVPIEDLFVKVDPIGNVGVGFRREHKEFTDLGDERSIEGGVWIEGTRVFTPKNEPLLERTTSFDLEVINKF